MTRSGRISDLMVAPTLTTARLRLRMPVLADFEHWAAFFASDRSVWEGGPKSRVDAYATWSSTVALWPLRGIGPFGVEALSDGRYLGEVGFYWPEEFPELEIGWFVVPEAEGRGIAAEAAQALLIWGRKTMGLSHIVNYITPGNHRSVALGERLGGVQRPDLPGNDPDDVVIWHDLTRFDLAKQGETTA
ncbi:GNAT family N-acetyltransferase [Oceanicola sp. 22II-s10i]|uniref:GNAT family N-acetyltransferase n=1 Tax=Oceanicola sp. 22II-s10i TaxID=1317116 RepID=UPI0020CFC6C9|nr:GNAT family protein [Oceanicola sp. 22II-s10i]